MTAAPPEVLLIHGSLHGITADVAAALRPFELAGGHVEIVQHNHSALVSYEGEGDTAVLSALLRILEDAAARSESAHGVFHFGFAHQEPASRYYGPAREVPALRSWLAACPAWLKLAWKPH